MNKISIHPNYDAAPHDSPRERRSPLIAGAILAVIVLAAILTHGGELSTHRPVTSPDVSAAVAASSPPGTTSLPSR